MQVTVARRGSNWSAGTGDGSCSSDADVPEPAVDGEGVLSVLLEVPVLADVPLQEGATHLLSLTEEQAVVQLDHDHREARDGAGVAAEEIVLRALDVDLQHER